MTTEYGWPLPRRIELFSKLTVGANDTFRLTFQDKLQQLPLIRIPIELPKYRILNGRTSTLQQEWLAQNPDKGSDFFTRDPESNEVQKTQHELLKKLVQGAGLFDFFKGGKAQEEPIILDPNGFVINGNRRLCAWRTLLENDRDSFSHFANIDAVVLPPSDDRAIDKLEAKLQVQKDIKDKYSWDAVTLMWKQRKDQHGLTDVELADMYETDIGELRENFEMLEYALQYLASRGKANYWSLVSGMEYAFRQMVSKRKKITSAGDKKLFEDAAYALLDDPKGGRLYEYIPDLQKFLPKVKDSLYEEFKVSVDETKADTGGLGDLFSDGSKTSGLEIQLAEIIGEESNREKASEVIKEVIESQRQMERETKTANHVLKSLQRANTEIQNAISGLKPETNTKGIAEQVKAIESGLVAIKAWIDSHA